MSHPERQAVRHRVLSYVAAGAAIVAAVGSLATLAAGSAPFAFAQAAMCAYLAWYARRARSLTARWSVGARSEKVVRDVLSALEHDPGYTVRHNLVWRGHGDIDHAVKTPAGTVIAIDTKTKTVTGTHLAKMPGQAKEAARQMRGRRGPSIVCVIAARNLWQQAPEATIVSADQLVAAICTVA